MAKKKTKQKTKAKAPTKRTRGEKVVGALEAVAAGAVGAAAGALAGSLGGPPGAIVGAVMGAGAAAGAELVDAERKKEKRAHNAELDHEIGVEGGRIGEAAPNALTGQRGTFSAASSGASGDGGSTPDAGPIPRGDA